MAACSRARGCQSSRSLAAVAQSRAAGKRMEGGPVNHMAITWRSHSRPPYRRAPLNIFWWVLALLHFVHSGPDPLEGAAAKSMAHQRRSVRPQRRQRGKGEGLSSAD